MIQSSSGAIQPNAVIYADYTLNYNTAGGGEGSLPLYTSINYHAAVVPHSDSYNSVPQTKLNGDIAMGPNNMLWVNGTRQGDRRLGIWTYVRCQHPDHGVVLLSALRSFRRNAGGRVGPSASDRRGSRSGGRERSRHVGFHGGHPALLIARVFQRQGVRDGVWRFAGAGRRAAVFQGKPELRDPHHHERRLQPGRIAVEADPSLSTTRRPIPPSRSRSGSPTL